MKHQRFIIRHIIFFLLAFNTVSAASQEPAREKDLSREAARIVQEFADILKPKLKKAVQSGGLGHAINICAKEAPKIADRLSRETGWTIKRVSLNPRNRQSAAPDLFEKKVLAQFDEQQKLGASPVSMAYSEIIGNQFRFMKAQGVEGLCLGCHGKILGEDVKQALEKYYPEDIATGYVQGQIRGAFSLTKTLAASKNKDDRLPKVMKHIRKSDNIHIERIGTYTLKKDGCTVCWEISVLEDKNTKEIELRTRRPLTAVCKDSFTGQLPLHRKVLKAIFKDWKKENFRTLFIGPLQRLNPTGEWNSRIAAASAESADFKDWRKNYPHHASGKSINRIFVETAEQTGACRELAALFEEFGLRIEMRSVEKVFTRTFKDMPFPRQLTSPGISDNHRLIYDAGMIYFSIFPLR